ncbi:hypothetical protein GCM10009798_15460 [Nocardioides panacihumi]|uniref:Peptidase C39-like domain-containing protein n=1 Tax=Nocardioides panacihumi TaxID=400774 RepID=A0ABN2QRB4_9ACTN
MPFFLGVMRFATAGFISAGLALHSPAALADGPGVPGTVTGGDVSSPAAEFADNPDSVAKVKLTELWQRAVDGDVSPEAYEKAAASWRAAHGISKPEGYQALTTTTAASGSTSALAAAAAPPASRTLPLTYYAQIKSYYCGPATGAMLIKITNGAIASRYNGASFAQGHLAGPVHMDTESNGATPWASGGFVRGVNRWRGSNYYVQVDRPSATLMKSALRQSIGSNRMPLAADTVEFKGLRQYNHHPKTLNIGHWILAYGYANSGATVKFADASTPYFTQAAKTFSDVTSTFTTTYLQNNGIAY